ncbi:hypothetical protein DL93DRAFT_2091991 [Clavulina sp. PMI_390]|nr:hypothetical protein DL93DRAFT_2091991 [Clavulina sp. PMI_390]
MPLSLLCFKIILLFLLLRLLLVSPHFLILLKIPQPPRPLPIPSLLHLDPHLLFVCPP